MGAMAHNDGRWLWFEPGLQVVVHGVDHGLGPYEIRRGPPA
jgi:hypothetical protein